MDEKVRAYLIEVLTFLGQMNHPRGKDAEEGIMTMKTQVRSYLIAKGWWEILEPERAQELEKLYGIPARVKPLEER